MLVKRLTPSLTPSFSPLPCVRFLSPRFTSALFHTSISTFALALIPSTSTSRFPIIPFCPSPFPSLHYCSPSFLTSMSSSKLSLHLHPAPPSAILCPSLPLHINPMSTFCSRHHPLSSPHKDHPPPCNNNGRVQYQTNDRLSSSPSSLLLPFPWCT